MPVSIFVFGTLKQGSAGISSFVEQTIGMLAPCDWPKSPVMGQTVQNLQTEPRGGTEVQFPPRPFH